MRPAPYLSRKWRNRGLILLRAPIGICPTPPQLSRSSLQLRYLSLFGGKKKKSRQASLSGSFEGARTFSRRLRISLRAGGLKVPPRGWRRDPDAHSGTGPGTLTPATCAPLALRRKGANRPSLSSSGATLVPWRVRMLPSPRPRPLGGTTPGSRAALPATVPFGQGLESPAEGVLRFSLLHSEGIGVGANTPPHTHSRLTRAPRPLPAPLRTSPGPTRPPSPSQPPPRSQLAAAVPSPPARSLPLRRRCR